MTSIPLILASGSPRRRELLESMGLSYSVDVSDVDESFEGCPDEMVIELSRRKARAVAERHESSLILAADTIVYCDQVLGKPESREHAVSMLKALSGRWHSVYTGITLINTATGNEYSRAEETRVHFAEMTDTEICEYVAGGEPMDKAGAYAIQGRAGMYIDRIEGSYTNVVGLPTAVLREMILEALDQ